MTDRNRYEGMSQRGKEIFHELLKIAASASDPITRRAATDLQAKRGVEAPTEESK